MARSVTQQRGGVFYGWVVVGGAFLALLLSFGALYAFGSFFTPLERAFDANRALVASLFGITLGLGNSLGFATGAAADRTGPRPLILIGGLCVAVGLIFAGRATSFWHLYVTYALGVGLGIAFILVPATETVQRWFVRRRGFASGLAVAGIGAGNLAAPPLAAALLRVWSWGTVFAILGVIALVGIVVAALLLVPSPDKRGLRPDGDPPDAAAPPAAPTGLSLAEAARARTFWLLYAALLIGALGAFVPFVHLVPDAEAHGIQPVTASLLLGLVGAGSIAGRFTVGGWADRIGRRWGFAASFGGMGLFLAWWLVADQVWSLALFAFGFGVWYGSFAALAPALGADYFGPRHLGLILGVLYTSLAPGAFFGPTLAGWAYDLDQRYTVPIAASVVVMALALVCTLLLPDPRSRAAPAAAPASPLSPTRPS